MSEEKRIRVLIADDHSVVRAGIASILGLTDDIEVVGEATNGKVALRMVRELRPDVVVMDLMMPVMGGAEATAAIRAEFPETGVLVLTTFGFSDDIARALDAGALGAVIKTATDDRLVSAIRGVAAGRKSIAPEVARSLRSAPPPARLTERQLDILRSMSRGLTNQEIATQFGISLDGVKAHARSIFAKIGAANRSEAVAIALRTHLLKGE